MIGFEFLRINGSHYIFRAPNGQHVSFTLGHRQISDASVRNALL